jgi:nucleoside-diphosphate-sugar epimerase
MSSCTSRHVLVTGAGGFIGSHLVETLLQEGADVRALVRYNSRNNRGLLELVAPESLAEVDVVPGDIRLDAGLAATIAWIDEHRDLYRVDHYVV